MPKIQRKGAKIFAENANAEAGGLAQFGSLAAGTPNYSTDPEVIQSLSKFSEGWSGACLGTKSPALEDRNAVDYVNSYQINYLLQQGIPEWLSTQTYYENNYVVDSNGKLRISLINNNVGNDPALDNGGQYWGFGGGTGAGKAIGEVFYSQSSSAQDNPGALPLFTGETISNADQVYPEFYTWVADHTGLQISAADYETAISTYGECPKYVIDTVNKTIRLPKLANYVKMANTTDGISQAGAGLPNITGKIDASSQDVHGQAFGETHQNRTVIEGAFEGIFGGQDATSDASGGPMLRGFKIDASRSSSIYGNSNTVTPANTTLFPWVCAYTAAVAASTAQAAEFQQALSSKADATLGNITSLAGANLNNAGVRTVVETYQNGDSWYRKWSDGYCEQGGVFPSGGDATQTLTLLVPYANTNYQVWYCGCGTNNSTDGSSWRNLVLYPETNSTVIYRRINYTRWWRAAGYTI